MKKTIILLIMLLSILVLTCTVSQYEFQKIMGSDTDAHDIFGNSVSVSGIYAVVGDNGDDLSTGQNSGSAYVYKRINNTWVEKQKLTASDGSADDDFGCSVSISGDWIIIGAQDDDTVGSAYFFHLENGVWVEFLKITDNEDGIYGNFGCSVSISGDYAIIGDNRDNEIAVESGAAHIFHLEDNTWIEQQKIIASDGAFCDRYGSSVSISGNHVIIGSYEYFSWSFVGAAYTYELINGVWDGEQKLLTGRIWTAWEYSVAISENHAVVGVGRQIVLDTLANVYIFQRENGSWIEQQRISSINNQDTSYGNCVSISGDYLAVANRYNPASQHGSVHLFHLEDTTWVEKAELLASDTQVGNNLGVSVALSDDLILAGASGDCEIASNAGAAYFFRIEDYIHPPVNSQASIPENNTDEHSFQNAFASLHFTGNHSSTTIDLTYYSLEPSIIGNLPANTVNIAGNYWHVESSAGNVGTYDITFDLSEVEGIDNFNTLKFLKRDNDSSPWQDVVADLGATLVYNYPFITIQGLNGFSEFVPAGGNDNTLPVTLSSFNAIRTSSNFVELNWITKSETDMSGYNIFRNEMNNLNGALKVNTAIITASNLSTEHNYDFCDDEVELGNTYYYWLESMSMSGNTEFYGPVSVSLDEDKPEEFTKLGIQGIYPNPFNPETNIDYSVKEETAVQVSVYNMKGQRVRTLVDRSVSAGDHNVVWHGDSDSGSSVSSGVYFVKMITGSHIETRKIVLMK